MLTTLIRQELLSYLMTFRFAAAVFIMLLLVVTNTNVLLEDYKQRLAGYNTAVKTHQQLLRTSKTYSDDVLVVNRPPNPLSIFNVGLDKRIGNLVEISINFVPTLWDAHTHGGDNPFLNVFTSMDLVFIFEVVLSLIAFMFAYDAIAGEREQGTLRLLLTHPLRRGHILIAKYISAMLCLLVPLLLSLLFALILLTTSPSFSLSIHDFLCLGGIILSSLAYLSVFYLIGMLISASTRSTSIALMLSMFVWGFLVIAYPNMILTAIETTPPAGTGLSTYNQIKQIWEEFDTERKQFLIDDKMPGEDWTFDIMGRGYSFRSSKDNLSALLYYNQLGLYYETLLDESQPQVPHAQNYYRFVGRRTLDIANKTWIARKPALEVIYVQPATLETSWLKLSPVGIYDTATQAWAGTDIRGVRDFFDAARRYRQIVTDYFYDTDAFGSRQWFSADKGAADWTRLPQFSFQRNDVGVNAKRALPNLFLLLMINAVLFTITFLVFLKIEV